MSTTSTASSSRPNARPTTRAPTSPAEVRTVLGQLGITPTKRLGQSFLTDAFIADAEAALALPSAGAPVVEVGGGLGILTEALLRRLPGALTVIERDPRLARHLRRTFGRAVTVVEADARDADLDPSAVVVGNLPFSVATPILLRCFAAGTPRLVALVQREVAERLAAAPGTKAYGRLTIAAALFGTIELYQVVPARAFHPTPAVEGQILVFTRRPGALPVPCVPDFERMVAALFGSRRKQLGNLVPRVLPRGVAADALAARADWPADWARRRPEELAPEAFFRLARERARLGTSR